jgi:hypothetical protein
MKKAEKTGTDCKERQKIGLGILRHGRRCPRVQAAIFVHSIKTKESAMNLFKSLLLIGALGISGAVLAEDASVTISSPANGAKVGTSGINVAYDVVTGPKGDHVHFYVDDKEVKVLRQLKGTYTVDSLKAGEHTLCIKIVDKGHTPIGVEKCIKVTAG